jgi:hypothetical protein
VAKAPVSTKLAGNKRREGVAKRKYNKHNPKPKSYRGQGR